MISPIKLHFFLREKLVCLHLDNLLLLFFKLFIAFEPISHYVAYALVNALFSETICFLTWAHAFPISFLSFEVQLVLRLCISIINCLEGKLIFCVSNFQSWLRTLFPTNFLDVCVGVRQSFELNFKLMPLEFKINVGLLQDSYFLWVAVR